MDDDAEQRGDARVDARCPSARSRNAQGSSQTVPDVGGLFVPVHEQVREGGQHHPRGGDEGLPGVDEALLEVRGQAPTAGRAANRPSAEASPGPGFAWSTRSCR